MTLDNCFDDAFDVTGFDGMISGFFVPADVGFVSITCTVGLAVVVVVAGLGGSVQ